MKKSSRYARHLTDEGPNVEEEDDEDEEEEDDDDDDRTLLSFNDVRISSAWTANRNELSGHPCCSPREQGIWVGTAVS
jgi:hypothetical protein